MDFSSRGPTGDGRLDVWATYYDLRVGISVDHEWSVGAQYPGTFSSNRFTIENKSVDDRNVGITISECDAGDWITITVPEEIFTVPGEGYVTFDASINIPGTVIGSYICYIQVLVDLGLECEYTVLIPVSVNVVWDGVEVEEFLYVTGELDECGKGEFVYGDWVYYTLEVPVVIVPLCGFTAHITLSLDWMNSDNDLNLYLFCPDGIIELNSTGVDKQAMISVGDTIPGRWIVAINARSLTTAYGTYNLTVMLEVVDDPIAFFDTAASVNQFPSIAGTNIGTITPNTTVIATRLYTYAIEGTGWHTKFARIWNATWNTTATLGGYVGDWRNISFNEPVLLSAGETYSFMIITG